MLNNNYFWFWELWNILKKCEMWVYYIGFTMQIN